MNTGINIKTRSPKVAVTTTMESPYMELEVEVVIELRLWAILDNPARNVLDFREEIYAQVNEQLSGFDLDEMMTRWEDRR